MQTYSTLQIIAPHTSRLMDPVVFPVRVVYVCLAGMIVIVVGVLILLDQNKHSFKQLAKTSPRRSSRKAKLK